MRGREKVSRSSDEIDETNGGGGAGSSRDICVGDEDEDRAASNRARSARRARGRVRRYCVANQLRYFWTLTNGPKIQDRDEMRRRVQAFMRKLQTVYGPLPYVYVLELHKDGVSWHAHFIIARRLPHAALRRMWGHGIVHVSEHGKQVHRMNQREAVREVVRRAASYVAKYVTKAYEAGDGRHGYEVGQGFQPAEVVIEGDHLGEVLWELRRIMGGAPPVVLWDSDEVEGWEGPRCLWGKWP